MRYVSRTLLGAIVVLGAAGAYCAVGALVCGVWFAIHSTWDWKLFVVSPVIAGFAAFILYMIGEAMADTLK